MLARVRHTRILWPTPQSSFAFLSIVVAIICIASRSAQTAAFLDAAALAQAIRLATRFRTLHHQADNEGTDSQYEDATHFPFSPGESN